MPDGDKNSLSVLKHRYAELAINLGRDCRLESRDLIFLENRIMREGLPFLTIVLPTLGKALLKGISTGYFEIPNGFAAKSGTKLPRFMFALFSAVFAKNGHYLGDNASDRAVRDIHQFTGFFYKMKMDYSDEQVAEYSERFKATDAQVSSLVFDKEDPILRRATYYVTRLFGSFDPEKLVCKDGPGVTSNCSVIEKKTKKLANFPCTQLKYLSQFFLNWHEEISSVDRWPDYQSEPLVQTSKVIFVPKDSRGPRVISAEPRECQWLQQGIRDFMYSAIKSNPVTRGEIQFEDQTQNADAALRASIFKDHATLDLSEASDRISTKLVERLFSGVPELLEYLMVSRSAQTRLPTGEIVPLSKFAPMGSAVCFPVLATTIWCLLRAKLDFDMSNSMDLPMEGELDESILVYGDDIIVDAAFALSAMDTLEAYGLKVNRDKSFIACDFSESCGMDAYKGRRITPIRLRMPLYASPRLRGGRKTMPTLATASHVETCNQLAAEGRYGAALVLGAQVEENHGALPFGYEHSSYVCFHTGTILERLRSADVPRKMGYWHVVPVKDTNPDESGWSHLLRTIHSLGTHAEIPGLGVYDRYRGAKMARCRPPRGETPFPKSNWLPK
jgi:hypothetical protein